MMIIVVGFEQITILMGITEGIESEPKAEIRNSTLEKYLLMGAA